jgi:hypothetical protein
MCDDIKNAYIESFACRGVDIFSNAICQRLGIERQHNQYRWQRLSLLGWGLLPGADSKEFSLTDPERCSSIGFDILYDESATFITLTVQKLMASLPELIDKELVNTANQRLADKSIAFDYVPVEHGANIVILKRPEGATDMGIYPLIWEALADQYEGPWAFKVEIKQ